MKDKANNVLNCVTIIGAILYGIGIYIETAILKKVWGNSAVNYSIQFFGPLFGIIVVTLIEIAILLLLYFIPRLKTENIFMCWFWIFSLYQCAINTFLSFYGLPNEPINLFFKTFWPNFWYPIKEIVFISASLLLTWFWLKKVTKFSFSRLDLILLSLLSMILLIAIISSQLTLINSESNVYS